MEYERIGRGEAATSPILYAIDFIDISSSIKGGFSETIALMYAEGHSLRDISTTLNIGKTATLKSLQNQGIATDTKSLRKRGLHIGSAPYGYVLIQGQLHPDHKEQKIITIIMTQWRSGKPYNAIAKNLNGKGISPRTSNAWGHSTIRSIVHRNKEKHNS